MQTSPTTRAEAPPRSVARITAAQCSLDEPMILSLRQRKDGKWVKGERQFPSWAEAIKAAYIVCCRLDPKSAAADCGYMRDFKDGSYKPEMPWWARGDSDSVLFIWPKRVHDGYYRRLSEGTAHPIQGDEHLLVLPKN